jgi:hypothetical protein
LSFFENSSSPSPSRISKETNATYRYRPKKTPPPVPIAVALRRGTLPAGRAWPPPPPPCLPWSLPSAASWSARPAACGGIGGHRTSGDPPKRRRTTASSHDSAWRPPASLECGRLQSQRRHPLGHGEAAGRRAVSGGGPVCNKN